MTSFSATIFFSGRGIARHYDREVLADAALRQSLALSDGLAGGLIIAADGERLLIADDFDHVIDSFLVQLPLKLAAGEGMLFEDHYSPEGIRITLTDGVVSFDNLNGEYVIAPVDDVLTALAAAAERLAAVKALVATESGAR